MNTNQALKEKFETNLDRNSITNNILINVLDTEIKLQGTVNSYEEKNKIESIAWNTFGINAVNNELSIYNEN